MLVPDDIWMAVERMVPLSEADRKRSRRFYTLDSGIPPSPGPTRDILTWLHNLHDLEEFLLTHRRPPVKRVSPLGADRLEQHLAVWASLQRTQQVELCSYQDAALTLLPGFSWDPEEDRFEMFLAGLTWFVDTHDGRMPAIRSVDDHEHRLGLWVRRQKARYREGRLPDYRRDLIEAVPGWSWGTNRRGPRPGYTAGAADKG